MSKAKSLLLLLAVSSIVAMIGIQQAKLAGGANVAGTAEIMEPTGSSTGPNGAVQTSDGVGGFLDSGCYNIAGQVLCGGKVVTRSYGGCPLFYGDAYFNSPVNTLPADTLSASKVANMQALAVAASQTTTIGPSPEFAINTATNATAVPNYTWGLSSSFMDSGNYPLVGTFLASSYRFGNPSTVASPACLAPACDAHVIVVNTDNCMLYEMFQQANTAAPYQFNSGYIWNLKDYRLRNAYKIWWYGTDSAGTSSADVSGAPIWPMILTHDEICGIGNSIQAGTCTGQTVNHAWRIAFNTAIITAGYKWPATHSGGSPAASNQVYIGDVFRLPAGFDVTTCHNGANNGLAYPSWFRQSVLTTMKTYGVYFADYGTNGLISSDANQAWGDTITPGTDNVVLAGWLHCMQIQDLEIVDNTPRIISPLSMQVNAGWTAR